MPQNALSPDGVSIGEESTRWNTERLGLRFGVDIISAATAGALTCPVITVIDRAIIEKAAKGFPIRDTITTCFRDMIAHPRAFLLSTPFLLIYTLYTSTYLTANAIDTVSSTLRNRPFDTVFAGPAKFLTTTAVNMGICVYKDARFARIFGATPAATTAAASGTAATAPAAAVAAACTASLSKSKSKPVPKLSYGLFCLRDGVTIFASFNVPSLLAPRIPDAVASSPHAKAALAQFSCPALMQLVSTPMHLLGLDLYNRQPLRAVSLRDRMARIRRDYVPSCFARVGKIVPAYGVGGVVNVRVREELMGLLKGF